MGEEIISSHVNRGGDACIVRLFNVVGPKMDLKHTNYGRVFPNFTNRIMQNKPLEIYGSGEQTRSFLHIQDAVNAFINLIDKNLKSNKNKSIYVLKLKVSFLQGNQILTSH